MLNVLSPVGVLIITSRRLVHFLLLTGYITDIIQLPVFLSLLKKLDILNQGLFPTFKQILTPISPISRRHQTECKLTV